VLYSESRISNPSFPPLNYDPNARLARFLQQVIQKLVF
jgi:hypothetical protein